MKNPFIYAKNAVRNIFYTIRYPNLIKVGVIQSFEKIRIEIKNRGNLAIGSFNQNRGNLYIGVDGGNLSIGNHCFFNINGSITCMNTIEIGDNCKFGNNLVIVDHDHNFKSSDPEFFCSSITIGNNVWCGANVVILRGTIIGDNCVIGAGTVVKGTYPKNSLIYGDKGKTKGLL